MTGWLGASSHGRNLIAERAARPPCSHMGPTAAGCRARFFTVAVSVLAWALLLLPVGCGGQATSTADGSGTMPTSPSCRSDDDCDGGTFCDNGACVPTTRTFGNACILPDPDPATGKPTAYNLPCGAYICTAGRCRSCESDEQCLDTLGSPTCAAVPGSPGRRCGDYSRATDDSVPAEPPSGSSPPPSQ